MSVQHISAGMPPPLRTDNGRFFLPGASEFAGGLRLGEVIKGKVLRQYDGNRYQVNFDGHERVVDSNVPLSTGELIHGRVIGVGERVELQRVYPSDVQPRPSPAPGDVPAVGPRGWGRDGIQERLMSQYNVRLSDDDVQTLKSAVRNAPDANAMALVGAMINKLGLRQAPELLWPVYNALTRRDAAPPTRSAAADALVIENLSQAAALQPAVVRQLAEAIDRLVRPAADQDTGPNGQAPDQALSDVVPPALPALQPISDEQGRQSPPQEQLAYWLLNAQAEGTVAHRLGTLPLLLGDRLIEVDMSFFEQHGDAEQKPDAKHRKIMFSLTLENLGQVEVMARLAGTHASVSVATQDQDKTAAVARYVEQLKSLLQRLGWTVDQVTYETRSTDRYNGVVRSVVEHVVSHDSLDRLV